jgi:hypothetical protein
MSERVFENLPASMILCPIPLRTVLQYFHFRCRALLQLLSEIPLDLIAFVHGTNTLWPLESRKFIVFINHRNLKTKSEIVTK